MTAATLTLTDFLLARIAEDEAAAHYATTRDDVSDADWAGWWLGHYQHYTRHDPARVLAECEAKRRIVGWAQSEDGGPDETVAAVLADVCRELAAEYADHPDHREEWKP